MVAFNSSLLNKALVLSWAVLSLANTRISNFPGQLTSTLRVLATIPDSCQAICDGVVNTTTTCATFECICNPTTTTNIHNCVNCLIAVKPGNQTVINEAQGILGQYVSICNDGGISVPVQTASGFTGVVSTPTAPLGGQTTTSGSTNTATNTSPTTSASNPPNHGLSLHLRSGYDLLFLMLIGVVTVIGVLGQ